MNRELVPPSKAEAKGCLYLSDDGIGVLADGIYVVRLSGDGLVALRVTGVPLTIPSRPIPQPPQPGQVGCGLG